VNLVAAGIFDRDGGGICDEKPTIRPGEHRVGVRECQTEGEGEKSADESSWRNSKGRAKKEGTAGGNTRFEKGEKAVRPNLRTPKEGKGRASGREELSWVGKSVKRDL